ncbi:MAG: hypothetical protein ACYC99_03070 [Candidatus Geothermincolia bacterium]
MGSSLGRYLKKIRLRISLPFVNYEVVLDDLLDSKDVDCRITRLAQIKTDLEESISAVSQLQQEALQSKAEADVLRETVSQLQQDKHTAEELLKVPEESFARVLTKASARGRARGIAEGVVIGFVSGVLSSLFVWYLTK